jgi:adenosylcobinamide kinase/adenosylcobinamide-phosphate guanylyltransferase
MLILVTGGCRSGKSGYALELAGGFEGPRTFMATAQAYDDEMRDRIERHKRSRPPEWGLIEEPLAVIESLGTALQSSRTVVLDCITLWISNLVCARDDFGEDDARQAAAGLAARARASPAATILITNEVGSGIVPDNQLARRFRDCAGRANQEIARAADAVYLMTSGIALRLK